MNNFLIEVGRVIVSLLFAGSGLHQLKRVAFTIIRGRAQLMTLVVSLASLALLFGGLTILLGFYVDLGAAVVTIFLLPTSFIMHRYWEEEGSEQRIDSQGQFWKNAALYGASLILIGLVAKHHAITSENFGWVISKEHIAFWK